MPCTTPSFVLWANLSLPTPQKWGKAIATTALTAALLLPRPIHAAEVVQPPHPASTDVEHNFVHEAWNLVNQYYLDPTFHDVDWSKELDQLMTAPLLNHNAAYSALKKSLAKLEDPFTRILNPKQMETLRKFDVSGVGLLLTQDQTGALVVATNPAPDTAAAVAGVKRGDVVLSVDGNDVEGAGAFKVAEWMQGPEGSVLKIRFRDRGETSLIRTFETPEPAVTRVTVVDRPDGRMGYIRLKEFRASGRSEVSKALATLREQGAEWIALDLRGNGGGIFEGALEIAGLLEGEGHPVALVKGRTNELRDVYKSQVIKGEESSSLDLAVILDEGSASSSEVLAGALRDECRAALVGSQTFGKGVIQGVFGLPDGGGIVVTVAEYRTPRGDKIEHVGLQPDIPLKSNGIRGVLQAIGIERVDEKNITISHDQVKDVIKMCQTNYRHAKI